MEAKSGYKGDNDQINPSSIFKYLGMSGLGKITTDNPRDLIKREFNAIPYLAYYDIYKQYYADKQLEVGAIIHNKMGNNQTEITKFVLSNPLSGDAIELTENRTNQSVELGPYGEVRISFNQDPTEEEIASVRIYAYIDTEYRLEDIFNNVYYDENALELVGNIPKPNWTSERVYWNYTWTPSTGVEKVNVETFDLDNIDAMRKNILSEVWNPSAFRIDDESEAPYGLPLYQGDLGYSKQSVMEGLCLKTYQSDLFNNWVNTEWLDGENGVNSITAVDTSSGSFSLDSLQLSKKVYDMLNRIAVSGGTYDDWLSAVYTHQRTRGVENPVYCGGLIRELAFQEVISQSATEGENQQPLGTLAGRGVMTQKKKGGDIYVKVEEPSIIMGIVSLTPRIDYSQGNDWSVNLKTIDDYHKPPMDQIGFQELITDQLAWWDTEISNVSGKPVFKSAGKQPAWINYMTNVNKCYGNFAEQSEQMYMTLNRRYEQKGNNIKDLSTYIDPSKFNHIFADTRLDAQNFWTQIGVGITARRKMSAKLMPNL
jgi:hypothetical protein